MSTSESPAIRHILLGVDGSDEAERALVWTRSVAGVTGAQVTVVCAFEVAWSFERPVATIVDGPPGLDESQAEQLVTQATTTLTEAGVSATAVAVEGTFPQAVHRLCEEAAPDLVVIGGRTHGGARELLLGSNAEKVVRTAPVSVLVVR